ncbi:hypothetical protein M404DRAFT_136269, partial [Pisolithus tinctorius Marx 270]
LGLDYDGDECSFSSEERDKVTFKNGLNQVIQSKRFQINYTTYDIRRGQDTLRPGHGATVMMLSREESPNAHPFWYARVLGAFLINVCYSGTEQTMEFLWVRWLGVVPSYQWGLQKGRLPKIGFVPDLPGTFGFLDPSLIIRACHLIPAFVNGHTDSLLRRGPSMGHPANEVDDWEAYYVNIFADRDMFARFSGIGIGHDAQYSLPELVPKTSSDSDLDLTDASDHSDQESPTDEDIGSEGDEGLNDGDDIEDESGDLDSSQTDGECSEDSSEDVNYSDAEDDDNGPKF